MEKTIHPKCDNCSCFRHSILKHCNSEELEKSSLSQKKIVKIFKKGQPLYMEGENPFWVFCIYKGNVKITKRELYREHIIKIAHPGDNLGYHAIILNTCFSHSAVAMNEVIVCLIPKDYFLTHVCYTEGMIQKLATDYIEVEERLKVLSLKSARERLANAILENASFIEEQPVVTISRTDLSNIVGTAKETTIRLLAELREEGVIKNEGKRIKILNREKLERIRHLYEGKVLLIVFNILVKNLFLYF